MPVIEYKFTINANSRLEVPGYVVDRGYWHSPIDKTLVGWCKPESERDYWVPDTIVELSKADLVARVLSIHAVTPYLKAPENPEAEDVYLTEAEVTTMIEEWYDNFVAKNSQ